MSGALACSIREKRYGAVGDAPPHLALKDVDFLVAGGEFVAIVGPSGCGKTTILNIVAGLDQDFAGNVRLEPRPDGAPPRLGYVFQTPRLLPWRTVYENVALVLPADDRRRVVDLLSRMGVGEALDVYPSRLSLGMSRRVALARAFVIQPDFLLMDEPFVSLDEATADRLRNLMLELWRMRPISVLFVTHDLRDALVVADRMILLSNAPGRVLADMPIGLGRDRRPPGAIEDLRRAVLERYRLSERDGAIDPA